MEFCLLWFFSSIKKKQASSELNYFFWDGFLLPFYLFNCCCIFHSTSIVLLSHAGACYQRVLSLKRFAVGSAKHLCNQQAYRGTSTRPRPRVEKEGGGALLKGIRWSQLTRNSQVLGVSIMKPLVNCRWLQAYFTGLYQSLCILLTLFHWVEAIQFYELPNPLLVGNKFLLGYISRDDIGWWPISLGKCSAYISSFSFSLG